MKMCVPGSAHGSVIWFQGAEDIEVNMCHWPSLTVAMIIWCPQKELISETNGCGISNIMVQKAIPQNENGTMSQLKKLPNLFVQPSKCHCLAYNCRLHVASQHPKAHSCSPTKTPRFWTTRQNSLSKHYNQSHVFGHTGLVGCCGKGLH